jgi:imidazole glycerol-phosphate synthase subunit HisH
LTLETASTSTVIVDYGTGNLNSVRRTLARIGARVSVSSAKNEVARADKIILPGVGHFGRAMEKLRALDLIDTLHEAVLVKHTPVLGICLGMELMAGTSEEGNSLGLGWLDADTIRFQLPDANEYKVPHMGWNAVRIKKDSNLMRGIDESAEFYFAHSYHVRTDDSASLLCETEYGITFPSAIEKDNIFAVQFHPEKSHDAGARLLKNFLEM